MSAEITQTIHGSRILTKVSALFAAFLISACDLHENSLGKAGGSAATHAEIDRKLAQLDGLEQKLTKIQEDLQVLKEKSDAQASAPKALDTGAVVAALKDPLRAQIDEAVRAALQSSNATAGAAAAPAPASDDGAGRSRGSGGASGPIDVKFRQIEPRGATPPR